MFCASIIIKGPDSQALLSYLRERRRVAWVSHTQDGVTVVFDNEFGGHDIVSRRFEGRHLPHLYPRGETAWEPLARDLSALFVCVVFAMEVYDGDYFYYEFFKAGHLIDEYVSDHDPFGDGEIPIIDPVPNNERLSRSADEHADALCRAFGNETARSDVACILADSGSESSTYCADAIGQFRAVVEALDLPDIAGMGGTVNVMPENAPFVPDFTATRWKSRD
jgi:hypothetical protein